MKIGYFGARADERGLARQSQGFCKHLQPTRVFGIDMTADDLSPYPVDWSVYTRMNTSADLTVRRYTELDADEVYSWLRGLDVVIGAETFYRDEFYDMAKKAGVRTVLQINPEFSAWWGIGVNDPRPDVFINPTIWRMEHMAEVHHLPFPVDREVFAFRQRNEAKRFVHVAGHAAMGDRAGTRLCLSLLPRSRGNLDFEFIIRSQSPLQWTGRGYVTAIEQENKPDPRDLYADADVMVLPRRYGGQCLTVNEALSCGVPVIMLDRTPENTWPGVITVPARRKGRLRTKGGHIDMFDTNQMHLWQTIKDLVENPELVKRHSLEADRYAHSISWDVLLPVYQDFLQAVVDGEEPRLLGLSEIR